MKLLIELPDGYVGVVMRNQRIDGSAMDKLLRQAVIDGTPLDDVCEWEFKDVCYTTSIKHYYSLPTSIVKTFNNCPYCGKKIKVVE